MRESIQVSTYLAFPSNAWICAALYQGRLVTRTYLGYTKRDAIRQFKRAIQD